MLQSQHRAAAAITGRNAKGAPHVKYAILICRILLGAAFLFFGANILLHFLPQQTLPGDAGTWSIIMEHSGYMRVVGLLQVIGGLLLLVGRFVPLGLTLLAPIVANILLFHAFLAPSGLPVALIIVLITAFLIFVYRAHFRGLFAAGLETSTLPRQ